MINDLRDFGLCMVTEMVMSSETGIYTKFSTNFLVQVI
jgi:hypothetical protein